MLIYRRDQMQPANGTPDRETVPPIMRGSIMKDNQQIKPVVSEDFSKVTFEIRGMQDLVLDMSALHPDILKRAAAVGMAQVRIIDAAAVSRDDGAGGVRSVAEMLELKRERMEALISHYMTGTAEWTQKRAAGGGGAKDTSGITLQAMRRVWPDKDCEGLAFKLETKRGISRKEAYAEFAKTKEVAAAIAAIKAERSTMSADDLLDEMEGGE